MATVVERDLSVEVHRLDSAVDHDFFLSGSGSVVGCNTGDRIKREILCV